MLARSSCEGDPHKDGSPEAAPEGGLPCGEPPGPAPGVTARAGDCALARRVLGNGDEHAHEIPTLTLPFPFQGEGILECPFLSQGEGLHPLVRVHMAVAVAVAVNVPVPVRGRPLASFRLATGRSP